MGRDAEQKIIGHRRTLINPGFGTGENKIDNYSQENGNSSELNPTVVPAGNYARDLRLPFLPGSRTARRLKELTPMANETSKTKSKRLSKGQRTHVRRLKQAARKARNTPS